MRKARAISAELDPSVRRQNILQVKGCGETAFNYRPRAFSIAVAQQEQRLRPLAAPALPGRREIKMAALLSLGRFRGAVAPISSRSEFLGKGFRRPPAGRRPGVRRSLRDNLFRPITLLQGGSAGSCPRRHWSERQKVELLFEN